jgi:DNA-binding MarR family transcriptional regulator
MSQGSIKNIRRSTREIVQQLGYLNNLFAHIGSISQCYALQILEEAPLTIQELTSKLSLESSTVSRLAKDMVHKGYCEYAPHEQDGRFRVLKLTALGRQQLHEIHTQANKQVATALAKLNKTEQETVTHGLLLYADALKESRNHD